MSYIEKHPRKLKRLALRVTDAERAYLKCLADHMCGGNISEANRWLIHQSLLLAAASTPELKRLSIKLHKGIR